MFVCVEVGLVFDYLNVYAVSRHLLVEPLEKSLHRTFRHAAQAVQQHP